MVRGNTRFISNVEHDISRVSAANEREISCLTREVNLHGVSNHPCIFLSINYINYRFSTNMKRPEAMIGDCLKSDNFHMQNVGARVYQSPKSL